MGKISINDVQDIQKHDRVSITYLNKYNESITKNTRFYGIDNNIILVFVPKKQKQLWEIPEGSECVIQKI